MTITVIIPILNEAGTLPQQLSYTSTLAFDHIILADGGSTDGSLALVRAFCERVPNARLVSSPRGRARQMNDGVKASSDDVLVFVHADTRLPIDARPAIERALHNPQIVGGRFDVRFDSLSPWARLISGFMNRRSRWTGIATGDQAVFVRRNVFELMGGFAEIPLMEDIDFSRRLKRMGPTAKLRETVTTSFRRWEQQGPLQTILLMWTLRFLYWMGVSPITLNRWYRHVR